MTSKTKSFIAIVRRATRFFSVGKDAELTCRGKLIAQTRVVNQCSCHTKAEFAITVQSAYYPDFSTCFGERILCRATALEATNESYSIADSE
jgi:hypothetical protein